MVETKTIKLPVTLPKGFEACERCANRLKDSLLQMDGVVSVKINPQASSMTLVYDPHLTPLDDVEKRANIIGVELGERFEHKTLGLVGLDCPDCALKLEKGVGRMDGVLWVSTNFAAAKMSVEFEPGRANIPAISKRVRDMGYDVVETDESRRTQAAQERAILRQPGRWKLSRQVILTTGSGLGILIAYMLSRFGLDMPSKVLFLLSSLLGGIFAVRGALYSLRSLSLDMNFLMTVAAIGAIAIGEWFDGAMVMFLFSLGNALEARSVERARESVHSLVGLFPTQARVRRNGEEVLIPASEVRPEDIFVLRPGEKIATDGIVISGSSAVNQASITGESVPAEKNIGDVVFAGSINQNGSIEVKATASAEDNTLAKIIHLVEEAQSEKAPSQRFTEVFGKYYTPVVIGLAILIALVPPLFGAPFRQALYTALTLLVVSCPCALVISTPVSIVSAIGNGARNGVLFKGGSHLESAGIIKVVAFDKTGTLTTGKAHVTDIVPAGDFDEDRVLSLAASIESRSEHPLADAIRREAKARDVEIVEVTGFEALTGMGAAAKFDGDTCIIGNTRLMEQLGVDIGDYTQRIDEFQQQGKTAVLLACNGKLAGILALADTLRETAKEAFRELRRIGIERIVMLTGDNELTARAVARDLDVDEYYAELLPQDKVDIVRVLIERFGSKVMVIGDGVNDAPALAASTVGVAMGAAGSDTALETADIALMSDDLLKLPYAIKLSRKALSVIKQNLYFSLGVIGLLISTALLGWLTLSLGVFGHEGSALIVIANGMRLIKYE